MALATNTATELTAEQVQMALTKPLEESSTFLASGPHIYDTPGPIRLPKAPGASDVSWVGEGELIPESDAEFDEPTLLPSTMKSLKVLTRYSNEMPASRSSASTPPSRTGSSRTSPPRSTSSSTRLLATASPRRRACSPEPGRRPSPWVARSPSTVPQTYLRQRVRHPRRWRALACHR